MLQFRAKQGHSISWLDWWAVHEQGTQDSACSSAPLTPVAHQQPQPKQSFGKVPEGQCSRMQVVQKLFWMYERKTSKQDKYQNYSSRLLKSRFVLAQIAAWQDPVWKCLGWDRGPRELTLMDSLLRTRTAFSNMQAWQKASMDKQSFWLISNSKRKCMEGGSRAGYLVAIQRHRPNMQ